MRRLLILLLALVAASGARAQDLEREKRWADEIVPGLVVGDAVRVPLPDGRTFLGLHAEAPAGRPAVLLVHGIGVHPDHGVIGALRASLADAGFATLSIQMPVLRADATPQDYGPALLGEAGARIAAAARWLSARGARRVVLLSHSLGSRMAAAYFAKEPAAPFAAWICLGLSGGFGALPPAGVPVLDVYGERDLPAVLASAAARRAALQPRAGSSQLRIDGADHFYAGREAALQDALARFLARIE